MANARLKRCLVLALLAVAVVNPALLAQVLGPANGSERFQQTARRNLRRSRRTALAQAGHAHRHRTRAVAASGSLAGCSKPASETADGGSSVDLAVANLPPLPAPAAADYPVVPVSVAVPIPSVARYLLFRSLLI